MHGSLTSLDVVAGYITMKAKSTQASRPFGFSGIRKVPFKRLAGFQKQHSIPQKIGYHELEFLHQLASPLIDQELDQIHKDLRQHFQFRRRELQFHHSLDGLGEIQTPEFHFYIEVDFDPMDPSLTRWQYRLTEIQNLDFLADAKFSQVFANRFTELIVARQGSVDIELLIDTIEDQSIAGIELDYDKEATWCKIQLVRCRSALTIRDNCLLIRDRGQANAGTMSPCDLIADYLTYRMVLTEQSSRPIDELENDSDFDEIDLSQLFPHW